MKAGTFEAKIEDYSIGETKAGDPQFKIRFKTSEGWSITWFGTMKAGKAAEITLRTLAFCGLKSADLGVIGDGPKGGALDMNTPLNIEVKARMYNGTEKLEVSHVGRAQAFNTDPTVVASAKEKLKAFAGEWAETRQNYGVKQGPRNVAQDLIDKNQAAKAGF